MNLRILAFEALRARTATPLRTIDRIAHKASLEPRDRALLRRIVATEVRRRGTLRAIVAKFAQRKLSPDLALHLRLGLVQLFFLDQIPDHAAVSETVSATMETVGQRQGRLANAVLRSALRVRAAGVSGDPRRDIVLRDVHFTVPVFHDPREHPLLWFEEALSLPVVLAKRWIKRYGEERARELARTALVEPDLSLRIVSPTEDRETILQALRTEGVEARAGRHERVLIVRSADSETILHGELFAQGRITVQGETALRSAEIAQVTAGERVLDLCAAPGGKTAVLAAGGARVVASDIGRGRLERVRETLRRLHLEAAAECVAGDGARAIAAESCDAVLVDAPCSNTGVLAKRPEARWRFGQSSQRSLALLQMRLLREGAACVRPGGRLVYATCSIEPEENQRRVRSFLTEQAEFALEEEIEALPEPAGGHGPVDGGYAARLRRSSRAGRRSPRP